MAAQATTLLRDGRARAPAWAPVFSLALGAFALVASEFMPVSLLTPIAHDLHISEGQAGQGISISGAFALLTSLFISRVAGRVDRKVVLLFFTAVMMVSGALVALAPTQLIFMAGRALIGIAIGGFWSMSAATAMRIVPTDKVPRALAIVNGGNALATVVAAPLGSFLGSIVGWRGAFFVVVPVAALVFVWQAVSLPSLKVPERHDARHVLRQLASPVVMLGMAAVSIFFMGQFTLYTYLRPFLETATQVDALTLSLILLLIGVAGFIGTIVIGGLIKETVYKTLIAIPAAMAVIAVLLAALGERFVPTTLLLGLWGLLGTAAPVGWWTWLSRTLPHDAETGGGLMVAVVQFAIMAGAVVGGFLYDEAGYQATFAASALMLVVASGLAAITARVSRSRSN